MINLCHSSDEDNGATAGESDAVRREGGGGGPSVSASAAHIDLTAGSSSYIDTPAVAGLMQLGFSADHVTQALAVAGGNKELAAQYLLDGTVNSQEQASSQTSRRRIVRSDKYAHLPMSFLLEDKNFYEACMNAHRHERGVSAGAVLESIKRLAKKKPDFIQMMAANPDRVIDLISNFEE